jgi:hypothetical protein
MHDTPEKGMDKIYYTKQLTRIECEVAINSRGHHFIIRTVIFCLRSRNQNMVPNILKLK